MHSVFKEQAPPQSGAAIQTVGEGRSGLPWDYACCDSSERERGGVFSVRRNGRPEEEIGLVIASLNLFELTVRRRATVKVRLWPAAEPRRWPARPDSWMIGEPGT